MATTTNPKNCVICFDPANLFCKTCKDAIYCTAECQRVDHRVHKLLCPTISTFVTPPKATTHLGILFPNSSETPIFIWIDFRKDEGVAEVPTIKSLHDVFGGECGQMEVEFNAVRARRLGDLITCFYAKGTELGVGNVAYNECVRNVLGKTKRWLGDGPMFPWRGNLLFIVQKGNELYDPDSPTEYRDARMRDFRDIVDFLSTYEPRPWGSTGGIEKEWLARARKLKGVHMQCLENEHMAYAQKSYPLDYPFIIKTSKMGSETPDCRLGMELMFYGGPIDKDLETNPSARMITTSVKAIIAAIIPGTADPDATYAHKQYNYHVVRADGNDLLAEHLEALCEFVLELILAGKEKVDSDTQSRIQQGMNMEVWKDFFLKFKEKRGLPEEFPLPWEIQC